MSSFDGVITEYAGVMVDCFAGSAHLPAASVYFLSHFHKDHTRGLERATLGNTPIYCSAVTRYLLLSDPDYAHLESILVPMDEGEPTQIPLSDGTHVTVTLVDANHCPGSVMFLFEGANGTILYTGDFRFENPEEFLKDIPCLHSGGVVKHIDKAYVDNTFAVKKFATFPSRKETSRHIVDIIREHPGCPTHISCGMFGYEPLLVNVSNAVEAKIHIGSEKMASYARCKERAPISAFLSRVSVTASDAAVGSFLGVHACSPYCESLRDSATRTVIIKPSAMWFLGDGKAPPARVPRVQTHLRVWHVFHSMHSSLDEFRGTMNYLRPIDISPIVKSMGCANLTETRLELFSLLNMRRPEEVMDPQPLLTLESTASLMSIKRGPSLIRRASSKTCRVAVEVSLGGMCGDGMGFEAGLLLLDSGVKRRRVSVQADRLDPASAASLMGSQTACDSENIRPSNTGRRGWAYMDHSWGRVHGWRRVCDSATGRPSRSSMLGVPNSLQSYRLISISNVHHATSWRMLMMACSSYQVGPAHIFSLETKTRNARRKHNTT